jgi:hypothetical protein
VLSEGFETVETGSVRSSVVYEKLYAAVRGFPAASCTAVVTFTVYVIYSPCPPVLNTAWLPEQDESVQTGLSDVMFVVFTVAQSTASSQLIVTLLFSATPVAPSAGVVEDTEGPAVSIVTVFPAEGVSTLLPESVALLWMV